MDESSRPTGRKKRVGSRGGEVHKRGDGLGGQTGGPVGDAGGYSDRTESPPPSRVDDEERGLADSLLGGGGASTGGGGIPTGGAPASGGGRAPSIGCSPKLLLILVVVIAVIAVVVYVMARSSGDGTGDLSGSGDTATSGLASGTSLGVTTTVDAGASPVVTSVSQTARAKRTVLKGNGADMVTVMVYICATDLESQGGMATADLNEMLYAKDSDKVNIIVETGGTSRWRNSVISSTTNQRYRVTSEGLELLEAEPRETVDGRPGHPLRLHPVFQDEVSGRSLHARPVGSRRRLSDRLRLRPELRQGQHDARRDRHRPQERQLRLRRDRLRRLSDGHAGDGHSAGALRRLHDRLRGDRAGHRLVLHRLADGPFREHVHADDGPGQAVDRRLRARRSKPRYHRARPPCRS